MNAPATSALPADYLEQALGDLAPDERKALDYIVDNADLIQVDGAPPHLLVSVTGEIMEILSVFGSGAEDMAGDDDAEDDDPAEDDDGEGDLVYINGVCYDAADAEQQYL